MPVWIVKKFGGSSVGSIKRIEAIAQRLLEDCKRGELPLVVISAMSGQTDALIKMASKIHHGCHGEAYDMLLSSGEQISVALLSLALEKRGVQNTPLFGYQGWNQNCSFFYQACKPTRNTNKIKKNFV